MQAVNKLAEIMARRENRPDTKKGKPASTDLKKKEKECRRLNIELQKEREKFNDVLVKHQKELQEQAGVLYEESQAKLRLQMEVDAKDSEIEQLHRRLANLSDTASVTSTEDASEHNDHGKKLYICNVSWKFLS